MLKDGLLSVAGLEDVSFVAILQLAEFAFKADS